MELGSRTAEAMMASAFGIEADRLLRFRGRLDHLRRHGCPSGTNTGKGRAAAFGWAQLTELMLALTLLDLGISPEHAARFVRENTRNVLLGLVVLFGPERTVEYVVQAGAKLKWPVEETVFLVGSVRALAGMRADGDSETSLVQLLDYEQLARELTQADFAHASNLVIDLGTRMATLVALVAIEVQRPPTEVAEDLMQWVGADFTEHLDQILGDDS